MTGKILRIGASASLCALSFDLKEFVKSFNPDIVTGDTPTEKATDVSVVKEETGWDRIKQIFKRDEFGYISTELQTIGQVACTSVLVGAVYGGFISSRTTYMNFIKNNQATAFQNHLDAKRRLQDAITVSMGKGAFRWSWRLCLFTTSFVTITTMITAYRNKNGFVEYTLGGALSGAMYKFGMGPQGMIVGGVVGGILGTFAGLATVSLLKLSGMTVEDSKYWQQFWSRERAEYIKQAMKKHVEKEEPEIVKIHDQILGKTGENLDNIR